MMKIIPPHPIPLPPGERGIIIKGVDLKIPSPLMGEGKGGGD